MPVSDPLIGSKVGDYYVTDPCDTITTGAWLPDTYPADPAAQAIVVATNTGNRDRTPVSGNNKCFKITIDPGLLSGSVSRGARAQNTLGGNTSKDVIYVVAHVKIEKFKSINTLGKDVGMFYADLIRISPNSGNSLLLQLVKYNVNNEDTPPGAYALGQDLRVRIVSSAGTPYIDWHTGTPAQGITQPSIPLGKWVQIAWMSTGWLDGAEGGQASPISTVWIDGQPITWLVGETAQTTTGAVGPLGAGFPSKIYFGWSRTATDQNVDAEIYIDDVLAYEVDNDFDVIPVNHLWFAAPVPAPEAPQSTVRLVAQTTEDASAEVHYGSTTAYGNTVAMTSATDNIRFLHADIPVAAGETVHYRYKLTYNANANDVMYTQDRVLYGDVGDAAHTAIFCGDHQDYQFKGWTASQAYLADLGPKILINTGDLTDYESWDVEDYDVAFNRALGFGRNTCIWDALFAAGARFGFTKGNHDIRKASVGTDFGRQIQHMIGHDNAEWVGTGWQHSFQYGYAHYSFLDLGIAPTPYAAHPNMDAELAWLDADLASHEAQSRPWRIVCTQYPAFGNISTSTARNSISQRGDLHDILTARRCQLMVCGDTNHEGRCQIGNVCYANCGTVAAVAGTAYRLRPDTVRETQGGGTPVTEHEDAPTDLVPRAGSRWRTMPLGGFVSLVVEESYLDWKYHYRGDGRIIDAHRIVNPYAAGARTART